ncbi:FAD/NAD(P)-binding protein [Paraburkholderia sp. CNPSo 3076]|nr:FAD/NAD(P)-binding protein [Paraburkholderia sp. CNPSo 3076]MCX5545325.1 FAD/NAD(P)-binding protein [Paraburkholderia sp. CNPSo 3076]
MNVKINFLRERILTTIGAVAMTVSIVIVGAGFCGTMTATWLLSDQSAKPLSIALVDDSYSVARGIAYRSDEEGWLLNAPARALSVERDNGNGFVDYCRLRGRSAEPDDFLPRAWYGDYLAHLLKQAGENSGRHQFSQHDGYAVALVPAEDGRTKVHLHTGVEIFADQIILATGHSDGRGSITVPVTGGASLDQRLLANPWDAVKLGAVPNDSHFFMCGSGLTALDVVYALHRRSEKLRFTLMSRRGLLPQHHCQSPPKLQPQARRALLDQLTAGPRHCITVVRKVIAEHRARGGDWREVIDSLRPVVPQIWSNWSEADRRAFVRHIAPYWDTHRHRQPASTAALVASLTMSGRLSLMGGRIETISAHGDGLLLAIRPREATGSRVVRASYFVNCTGAGMAPAHPAIASDTGPHADRLHRPIVHARDSLFDQLRRDGIAKFDWAGLCVDESYRVVRVNGCSNPSLFYIGPALRRRFWEATAVPELLTHIERMTEIIRRQFSAR